MSEILTNRNRVLVFISIFVLLYLILISKLFMIQVVQKDNFDNNVKHQSIRRVRIPAIRGQMISSDGNIIADNIPDYSVGFHLAEMRLPGRRSKTINHILKNAQKVADTIKRKSKVRKAEIISHMNLRPALPLVVFTSLDHTELSRLAELVPRIQGMEITANPKRFYPGGNFFSHLLGYTGKDDPAKAKDRKDYSYYVPDVQGRSGIEKFADRNIKIGAGYNGLRGRPGRSLLQVDVKGYIHNKLGISTPSRNGNDIVLTVNSKLQKISQQALKGKKGAVVVLNASTGAVLAMVSSPTYDINLFSDGISHKEWKKLIGDPDRPLFNRALNGEYMPGSIVKPLTAIATLKYGINPYEPIFCNGASKIGTTKLRCWSWKYGGHGPIDMAEAIKQSCNVYFVEVGKKIGLNYIAAIYKSVGIGEKSGIELPDKSGKLPSRNLKKRLNGRVWNEYDTALISIGQGLVTLTPLQAAVLAAAIGNGGTVWRPYIIQSVKSHTGKPLFYNIPREKSIIPLSKEKLNIVQHGMFKVVQDLNGSGKRAKSQVISLSGKTGTAQVGPRNNITHNTWFIGYGRYEKQLFSIAILVEGGKGGGMTNAPIAKEIFEKWLEPGKRSIPSVDST